MLSAIVLSKNSSHDITRTLKSLAFCDEIIVIDDFSDDNTVELSEKIGAKVYRHRLDSFAEARNFGMTKAQNEWNLFIDDDEVVENDLGDEILKQVQDDTKGYNGYFIKRAEFWHDKELDYGEVWKARRKGLIRLVKSGSGKWEGRVHERFITDGSIGRLNNFLHHYPHPDVESFLRHINKYSTMRSEELEAKEAGINILTVFFYPLLKFFYSYIILLGFLDGSAGFIYSFMMSFHSFLTRGKLMVRRLS